ncbi:hypothetical protein [Streptomyces sp. N35]|uniref:hypothetical protein n=1 Tax=Streptomyces sp. N35 TaxID=2795730 RepID=UPI0018F79C2D|nr:hypothetical protein [Streptomyces sp. N35]
MKNATSWSGANPYSPVADPELPAHVHDLIATGKPRTLEIYGDPEMPDRWLLGTLTHHVARVGLPIGAATGLWAVCKHLGNKTADAVYASNTGALHFLFERIAHYLGPLLIPAATLASVYVVLQVFSAASDARLWREVREARDRYVLPSQLTDEAAALLQQARSAARQILDSEVHERDLIDRQRAQLQLPVQVWEVARSLAQYSRLSEQTVEEPQGESTVALVTAWRSDLASGLAAIEQQVEALELYAAQTAEADARLKELKLVEQLEKGSSELLDFLAATVRSERAVEGIDEMTREASAVAGRFTTALIAAKEAAAQALPAAKRDETSSA